LKSVLQKEKIEFEEAAIKMIAKSAHGGMRDGLSLLDQLASVCGTLTLERTLSFLGTVDENVVLEILEGLAQNKPELILEHFQSMSEKGVNWPNLAGQIIAGLRTVLLSQFIETKAEDQKYLELAKAKGISFWNGAMENFLTAESQLKYSPIPELCLEMAVMKTINKNNQITK